MEEISALKVPAHQKMQLYNEALQKSQLYEKKTRRREIVKQKPLSESDILKGYRKTAQPRKNLKAIRDNKSSDWNDKGNLVVEDQVIPNSDIRKLLRSAVHKPNKTLAGWEQFDFLSKWKTL